MSISSRAKALADTLPCEESKGLVYNAYKKGATDQRKIDIEKACEWLMENVSNYLYNTGGFEEYIPQCGDAMFIDFRKAMEE